MKWQIISDCVERFNEEYEFKTINDFASKLMSHGFERIVFSKIKPD